MKDTRIIMWNTLPESSNGGMVRPLCYKVASPGVTYADLVDLKGS
jgi:hypothetical protein